MRIKDFSKTGVVALALTGLLGAVPVYAEDCPTAKTAAQGFIVERGASKMEVFHAGPTEVRSVLRYGGQTLLEVTAFQGLVDLERIDRGNRISYRPISDLTKTFPPVPGKKTSAVLEETRDGKKIMRTYILEVRKGSDTLYLGACKYNVLRIDRSAMEGKQTYFINTDYYAPELKLVLAKEYRESDGRTTLNKFEKIYPTPR